MNVDMRLIVLLLALCLVSAGCLTPEDLPSDGPTEHPSTFPSPAPVESPATGVLETGPITSISTPPTAPRMTDSDGVLFFWGVDCQSCDEVRPFVEDLAREHPHIQFDYVEIFRNETNATRYYEANRALGVAPRGIPEVIAGGSAFFGGEEIREGLPGVVQAVEAGDGTRGG